MPRILFALLIFAVVLLGCQAEATAVPTPIPQPTEAPTLAPTDTPPPTATEVPTAVPATATLPPTPAPVTGKVKSTLNVRSDPSTQSKLLGVLKKDDEVTLLARTEDKLWLEVNFPLDSQNAGWVIAERIDTTADLNALQVMTAAAAPTTAATQASNPTAVAVAPTSATTSTQTTVVANETVTSTSETKTPAAAATPAPNAGGAPTGSIIFDSFENGKFNIYRVHADGTNEQMLIAGASDPALAPNGSRLAYRKRNGTGGLGIATSDLNGANEIVLLSTSSGGYPTWSPDGNNIAYHILPGNSLPGRILLISNVTGASPADVGVGVRPAWQPGNGQFILFDGCKGSGDCGSLLKESAFAADPANPTLIIHGTNGSWSPNGSQVAFQDSDENGHVHIFTANSDGSNRFQVTKGNSNDGLPIWSADGQWLFYRTDQNGTGWAIYAIHKDGSGARKVIDSPVSPDDWVYAKLAISQ